MRRLTPLMLVLCVALAGPARAADPKLETDEQKTFYAMGLLMSQQLLGYDITQAEVDLIVAGLQDGVLERTPKVQLDTYGPAIQGLLTPRAEAAAKREAEAGKQFCAEAAKKPGAVTTESGVVYIEQEAGTGAMPGPEATVKLHYNGTLRDGTTFDSSRERGEPVEFALNRVIPCFSAGLQKMKVGGKSRLVCPADQAYGDRGAPPKIRPGAALVFDVELLEIVDPGTPATPPAPGE